MLPLVNTNNNLVALQALFQGIPRPILMPLPYPKPLWVYIYIGWYWLYY
jgi:hypothetical protein